jgi:hypothetical protein
MPDAGLRREDGLAPSAFTRAPWAPYRIRLADQDFGDSGLCIVGRRAQEGR